MVYTNDLTHHRPNKSAVQAGFLLAQSALSDSQTALSTCSPDSIRYASMVASHLGLTIAHLGPTALSGDLRQFNTLEKRMEITKRYSRTVHYGGKETITQPIRFYEDLVKRFYEQAAMEWDPIWLKQRQEESQWSQLWYQAQPVQMPAEKLADWILHLATSSKYSQDPAWSSHLQYFNPHTPLTMPVLQLDGSVIIMMCCNNCDTMSSSLLRCAGCGITVYVSVIFLSISSLGCLSFFCQCNMNCQKAHWVSGHKDVCKIIRKTFGSKVKRIPAV